MKKLALVAAVCIFAWFALKGINETAEKAFDGVNGTAGHQYSLALNN